MDDPEAHAEANQSEQQEDASPTYLDLYRNETDTVENRKNPGNNSARPSQKGDGPKWTDIAIVILTSGIVFFAFAQWHEMNNAGRQTDRIIAADERLAKAMENSVTASGRVLDATIAQNQLDQRAWVGVATWSPAEGIKSGAKARFQTIIANSGKTPALKFSFLMSSAAFPKGKAFAPIYTPVPNAIRSLTVVQPGAKTAIFSGGGQDISARVFNAADISQITSGEVTLYVYGRMEYVDIFGKTHHTTFCGRVATNLTDIYDCDTYNTAD